MKKQLSLLACLLLSATGAMAQAPIHNPAVQVKQAELLTWKVYSVKDEEVSASFSTQPAMSSSRRFRFERKQNLTDRMIGAYADGVVYALYVYDNPEPHDSLEAFIADHTQRDGWDTATGRPVKIGSTPGKEYSSTDKNFPATAQFLAVGDRLYKFTATGAPRHDPGVKLFFSSIAIGKKQGVEISDGPGLPFDQPGGDSLTGRLVDTKVRVVMKPEPAYTEPARQAATVGTVVLKVVFASSGSVTNISTVESLPNGLTEEAIAAAQKIKFIPATRSGKYVSMWMQLEYNFSLY